MNAINAHKRTYWTSLFAFSVIALLTISCRQQPPVHFKDVVNLPMTPVKDQGKSSHCWAYAMLATIETEHIGRGDSVHLSPAFVSRMVGNGNQRGMGHTLINILQRKGIVPFDTYPDSSYDKLPVPQMVFMLGARYTKLEFAHSVCAPGEYIALTSDSRYPYGKEVVLDVPDNWEKGRFLNVPKDTLLSLALRAVRNRHGVCWEGDTDEHGFSFERGIADGHNHSAPTDNHCMAIVGLAKDPEGRLFFKMKNSWGTHNPYHGLMYMSAEYLRDKTVALYMTREAATTEHKNL